MILTDSEPDWLGIAAVIGALGVTIPAVIAAIVTLRRGKEIHEKVTHIDKAVNGTVAGAQTMVANVQDMHDAMPPIDPDAEGVLPLLREIRDHLNEHGHPD